MKDRTWFLDKFLEISDYPILTHTWTISTLEVKIKAESEFNIYRVQQDHDYLSDFDYYLKENKE